MKIDLVPLIIISLIFVSSMISLKAGISVAVIETLIGAIAGNLGLEPQNWMLFLGNFGGIVLTFLAGTEIDFKMFKENFKISLLIGFFAFFTPFVFGIVFAYFIIHWSLKASLLTGTVISTTSLAVVYSVYVETGLSKTRLGKILMASTFVTNLFSVLAMSILFTRPTLYTLIFLLASIVVIILATVFSNKIFLHPKIKDKIIEPEIKYIFALLFVFMYFAELGKAHAILPVFLLGLFMSKHFDENSLSRVVKNRLRTVSYALITPLFFIISGINISFKMIYAFFGIFVCIFLIKFLTKFVGVYFFAKKYLPSGYVYLSLLMSTGLAFGSIASLFGFNSGIIDQTQYSILIAVVITSAIVPTFIAQKLFPLHLNG